MQNNLSENIRLAIFVDGSNLFFSARSVGVRVDYERLLKRLNGRQIIRALFYQCDSDRPEEKRFFKKIESFGFEVRSKPVKVYPDGTKKGNLDIEIAVDAISISKKVDVITIVSGDGDFQCLVHYLKSLGVRVEAMAFERSASRELKEAVDVFLPITPDLFLSRDSCGDQA